MRAEELELWAERVVAASVGGERALGGGGDSLLDRLDETFTHPFAGLLVFLGVMAALFWTIFALATVPMDLIEATFAHLGGFLEARLPAGAVRDLLVGGLIGGVSGTVVFLPQIACCSSSSRCSRTPAIWRAPRSSWTGCSGASACPATPSCRCCRATPAPFRGSSRRG